MNPHIRHILETKGLIHAGERAAQVFWRFVRGRRRFERMLEALETEFAALETRMTFCVTASLIQRHDDLIARLARGHHEIAAHGFHHVRMSNYDRVAQQEIIDRSYAALTEAGFRVEGFRCPYLNFNPDTLGALASSPFKWTSQHFVSGTNGALPKERVERLLKSLYHCDTNEQLLSLPRFSKQMVELPISAPDDEMLWERYRIRDRQKIARIWSELLLDAVRQGEVLHLLFHPERFEFIREPLLEVLRTARSLGDAVWNPTLGELASWWSERRLHQWEIDVEPDGSGMVWAISPPEAPVLERNGSDGDGESFIRGYSVRKADAEESGRRGFRFGTDSRPTIGVDAGIDPEVRRLLDSEGFFVETALEPERHSLHLPADFAFQSERHLLNVVESCRKPLLRLWRWPHQHKAVLCVSSDVDAITLRDFWDRSRNF